MEERDPSAVAVLHPWRRYTRDHSKTTAHATSTYTQTHYTSTMRTAQYHTNTLQISKVRSGVVQLTAHTTARGAALMSLLGTLLVTTSSLLLIASHLLYSNTTSSPRLKQQTPPGAASEEIRHNPRRPVRGQRWIHGRPACHSSTSTDGPGHGSCQSLLA